MQDPFQSSSRFRGSGGAFSALIIEILNARARSCSKNRDSNWKLAPRLLPVRPSSYGNFPITHYTAISKQVGHEPLALVWESCRVPNSTVANETANRHPSRSRLHQA